MEIDTKSQAAFNVESGLTCGCFTCDSFRADLSKSVDFELAATR